MGKSPFYQFLRLQLFTMLLITPLFEVLAADSPIGFEADNVVVNQKDGSLVATGNVELKQANNTLRADEITYYRQKNKSIAYGNVIHTDETGTITRATMMELDTEFTHIIAETLISHFANDEWLAADTVDRVAGEKAIFNNSRYTPCKCDFLNGELPLWEIKASQTVRNEKTQTITHFNMRMTVMNIPVGYLPFLSHPDSTVRRRSGFLTPSFIVSSDLGFTPSIPYYKIIDETSDAEFVGYRYQHRGLGVKTRYRKLWDTASLQANLYAANVETYKKNRELVGAIDMRFSSQIGNGWNVDAQLRRASQDTFMRRYNFNNDTSLKSNITATRTISNRYYLVEASDRQSLETGNKVQHETTVLPYVFFEKEEKGWGKNQRFRTELSALQLDNDEGHDLARWSGVFELSEEFQLPLGTANYKANATGNYYSLHSKPTAATSSLGDHSFITPALSIGWRLPIALTGNYRTAILEPQAQLAIVGGQDNTPRIPNRDSNEYRIDEANLFLLNRYQGKDYVLPGSRTDIGVSATTKDIVLGDVSGFFGVSRQLSGKASAGLNAGQGNKYSDYVASLSVNPENSLNIRWSGRLSSSDLTMNESKTSVASSLGTGQVSVTHNQIGKAYFASSDDDREELYASYTQPMSGGWTFSTTQLWDLSFGKTVRKKSTAQLSWNGGVQNCLYATIRYENDPVSDRDVDATDRLNLALGFKNLGNLSNFGLTSLLPTN
ncbi:LPS assembly protein LptD [Candidatus Puniceispirillum sp.]|nr:LPS assembly protein LptD [Candidatus Puniceispirillum sp.]